MTSVFQIIHGGKSDVVVANMEIGMDYIGRVLAPNKEDRERLRSTAEFPALDDERLCGSYYHRLCREAHQLRKSFVIVEHELKGVVLGSTEVSRYDLVNDFDPSYIVQDGLWCMAKGYRDVQDEAKMVHGFVALSVSVLRKSKSDDEIIGHLRRKHEIMKGPDLLSGVGGTPTDILNALPEIAREKFFELANIAFPEQIPIQSKSTTISP
ncbi:hypothetical protein HFN89_00740 [Rhizobium laguerreae]|nr:hypothetical protein [Rhizobium laguerreae]